MTEINLAKDPSINPAFYGLDDTSAARVGLLTEQELEFAYRLKARAYHVEDAERHCAVLLEDRESWLDDLQPEDYARMAELFEDSHDCNLPDNDQWAAIATAYIAEKFGEMP